MIMLILMMFLLNACGSGGGGSQPVNNSIKLYTQGYSLTAADGVVCDYEFIGPDVLKVEFCNPPDDLEIRPFYGFQDIYTYDLDPLIGKKILVMDHPDWGSYDLDIIIDPGE